MENRKGCLHRDSNCRLRRCESCVFPLDHQHRSKMYWTDDQRWLWRLRRALWSFYCTVNIARSRNHALPVPITKVRPCKQNYFFFGATIIIFRLPLLFFLAWQTYTDVSSCHSLIDPFPKHLRYTYILSCRENRDKATRQSVWKWYWTIAHIENGVCASAAVESWRKIWYKLGRDTTRRDTTWSQIWALEARRNEYFSGHTREFRRHWKRYRRFTNDFAMYIRRSACVCSYLSSKLPLLTTAIPSCFFFLRNLGKREQVWSETENHFGTAWSKYPIEK